MTRRVYEWRHAGATAVIHGNVFGLESEVEATQRLVGQIAHDRVLLGVSPEAVEAIAAEDGRPPEAPADALGPVTHLYLEQLARFGPVRVPAADLYAAWRAAREMRRPVHGIDLTDAAHTEAYVDNVSLWENIRRERRQIKQASQLDEVADLVDFVGAWDGVFFPTKGLRAVEVAREGHMAAEVRRLTPSGSTSLAFVPLERLAGVVSRLEAFVNLDA